MKAFRAGLLVMMLGVLLPSRAWPQAPATARPEPKFDVASIKPNKSDSESIGGQGFGRGRWERTNAPLKVLILEAFGVRGEQLVGLPAWADTERFDVNARTDVADANRTEALAMMQGLLKERFNLMSHGETRDVLTYDVLLARADGALGPGLQPTTHDCSAVTAAQRQGAMQNASPGTVFCGWYIRPGEGTSAGDGQRLDLLLIQFPSMLGRPVINKTGLTGPMSWTLKWRVDAVQSEAPELPTAFQEQLGLRLMSSHGPLDVIVIDRISRPTPD
jgi:bla regulator protein BlaR1